MFVPTGSTDTNFLDSNSVFIGSIRKVTRMSHAPLPHRGVATAGRMADARLGGPSRALEFYSGIGGMHHAQVGEAQGHKERGPDDDRVDGFAPPPARALRVAGLSEVKVVEAYDLNTTANVCYEAYFGLAPNPRNLETVVAADLPGRALLTRHSFWKRNNVQSLPSYQFHLTV